MPYGEINRVSKEWRYLRLSTAADSLEWDLTETLLWENSRKKVAEVVVAILQNLLDRSGEGAAAETGEGTPGEAAAPAAGPKDSVAVSVEIEAPVDWPAVIAFHAPIVLLGIPLIMPAAFALIASSGLGGDEFSRGIGHLDYVQLLTFGAMSLGPSIYAFGTRLQFSLGRYIPAAALVAFASIQALTTAMRVGSGAFPISVGGGLLGILVASALGAAGLSIFRLFRRRGNSP